jgi:GNAT superfamily N-acetyltransferase
MEMQWIRESPAYWDTPKRRIIGGAPDGVFRTKNFREDEVLPGAWWRVEHDGKTVGYGWMDETWGDAEVLLAVDADARRQGVGAFILDELEKEARHEGLNYLYNVVREKHPDKAAVSAWLQKHRFLPSHDDQSLLKRAVAHE